MCYSDITDQPIDSPSPVTITFVFVSEVCRAGQVEEESRVIRH